MSDIIDDLDLSSTVARPHNYSFLDRLNLSSDVKRRLSLHLSRIEEGSKECFLTPLGKDNDPDSLLADVDQIFSANSRLINSNLDNLEQSNRSKFGPRSIAKPWVDRKDSLDDYFKHQSDEHNAKLIIPKSRRQSVLRPLSITVAASYLKNNTNSGLPYYVKKAKIKDDLIEHYDYLLDRADPCILFTRTQEGNKTRNVWGYPSADTLNEMRFYRPLLDYQRREHWRSALLGPDSVDQALTTLMNAAKGNRLKLISLDFSAFDASVGKHLQLKCFDYIKSLYQKGFDTDIDYISNRFNTIGVVTPSGVSEGSHGVPSGATFTNEVDSLAQFIIAKDSGLVPDRLFQIQGDDGAYAISEDKVEALFSSFNKAGLNVNEEKSYRSSDYLVYLQKLYDFKYTRSNGLIGGIYPIYRALNRLVYQERFNKFSDYGLSGKDYYSIRTISILENCKYHPLFKEFVKYIYSKDKYSLDYSKEAIGKYNNFVNLGQGASGLIINQFEDNISGIASFETVKLVKELGLR